MLLGWGWLVSDLFLSNVLNIGWFSSGVGLVGFIGIWLGCFVIGCWRWVLGLVGVLFGLGLLG